jgi:hypothetical protein
MAQMSTSTKMRDNDEQFYFHAGGYVLLCITRMAGSDNYSVMTATASENDAYRPIRKPRPKLEISDKADGVPSLERLKRSDTAQQMSPKVYPDTGKLISAVASVIAIDASDMEVDQWGRPYVKLHGITSALAVRDFGNRIAGILGLEVCTDPWGYEGMQAIDEENSISGTGEDVFLNRDMSVSNLGDVAKP